MAIKKRCLLWDWTNTDGEGHSGVPWAMDKIEFTHISSLCNWNTWTPPELKDRVPFRPMIRTEAQLTGWEWDITLNGPNPIIHFFNEPERNGISAERAAEVWKSKISLLREKGKKICGPCVASDPGGEVWLDDFMGRVKDDMLPDFLGLHYYGENGDAAIEYLEKMHGKWSQLPVIVTEIASISRDKGEVTKFTAQLVNWMDKTDWVFEYAFFGCMRECADGFVSPQAQLMNKDGSFTGLMEKLMTEQPIKA